MGRSLGIKCSECNYSISLMLGIGMAYIPYNIVDFDSEYSILPSLIKSKTKLNRIKTLVKEKSGILSDDSQHEAYYCPKCSYITERFFFHIDYIGGSYEPSYRCNRCKSKLKKMELKIDEDDEPVDFSGYACPECGRYSLEEGNSIVIMWD